MSSSSERGWNRSSSTATSGSGPSVLSPWGWERGPIRGLSPVNRNHNTKEAHLYHPLHSHIPITSAITDIYQHMHIRLTVCYRKLAYIKTTHRPPLFIKKVLKALLSSAFSNKLRSLSGGFLSHRLLRLLFSGSSDTPGKTGTRLICSISDFSKLEFCTNEDVKFLLLLPYFHE